MQDESTREILEAMMEDIKKQAYSMQVWLEGKRISQTARGISVFHGPTQEGGTLNVRTYIDITDGRNWVRLERGGEETMEGYIERIDKLRSVINKFTRHLSKL